MIGKVPKGAPLRCKLHMHIGQERGGLMAFDCPRCGGSYWQTKRKYTEAMDRVREFEAVGDDETAVRIFERTMGRKS